MNINILFPVLNEELRLEKGINETVDYIRENLKNDYTLTIIDNGSVDKTREIAEGLVEKYDEVEYIRIEERGVGIAFKTGVERNTCDVVGYMDIDLSTDIKHLKQVEDILGSGSAEIVNASRYRKDSELVGRTWARNMVSYVLVWLLKVSLKMKSSDAICGFKFFKKETVDRLLPECTPENSWFYIIELLIRAERHGCDIAEIPVRWVYEEHTKVKIVKVTLNYLKGIARVRKNLKNSKKQA